MTRLLRAFRRGEPEAADQLMPLVYSELHRLAQHYMRNEAAGHTLQPTALVNEAYLKLIDQRESDWQNRAHFFGFAAQVMRHLLIDHARSGKAAKRGGRKVPLEKVQIAGPDKADEWLAIDAALERLARIDRRQARVVELRYFGGLSVEETAEVLGLAPRTVKRDWSLARVWLHREIGASGQP